MAVNVTGSVMAFLFYDIMNSRGDQEGFLLGEVTTKVTDDINDSHMRVGHEEVVVNVTHAMPCRRVCSFYNGQGQIDEEALKKILGDKVQDIAGWYRFRRSSSLNVFLREKAIHNNIKKLLPANKQQFFLFGLFTCSSSENLATHSVDHVFLRFSNGSFEGIPLSIINLGDTSQSSYKRSASLSLSCKRELYGRYANLKCSVPSASGPMSAVNYVREMQAGFQAGLKTLCQRISESEVQIKNMEDEIAHLKNARKLKVSQISQNSCSENGQCEDRTDVTNRLIPKSSSYDELEEQLDKFRLSTTSESTRVRSTPKDISKHECNLMKVNRVLPCEVKLERVNVRGGGDRIASQSEDIKGEKRADKS